jgi:hypothetical protein
LKFISLCSSFHACHVSYSHKQCSKKFDRKSKILLKNRVLIKIEIFAKNRIFAQKSSF